MSRIFISLINIYQATLSPDHSIWGKRRFPYGYCRFYPSCSQYAKQAVARHGVGVGIVKAVARILRCNPFSAGGYDPIIN